MKSHDSTNEAASAASSAFQAINHIVANGGTITYVGMKTWHNVTIELDHNGLTVKAKTEGFVTTIEDAFNEAFSKLQMAGVLSEYPDLEPDRLNRDDDEIPF